jgi:hypothetical protein
MAVSFETFTPWKPIDCTCELPKSSFVPAEEYLSACSFRWFIVLKVLFAGLL